MISTNEIWVICPDAFHGDLGEPIAAFSDKETADAMLAVLTKTPGSPAFKVIKVPVWPGGIEILEKLK